MQKIILLLCLIFFIHSASGYEPITIIGDYYESYEKVNNHLGDDTDPDLTPSDPDTLSYTKTFQVHRELRRQQVRLVLTVVNVLPEAAKEEDVYNNLVYINGIYIGKLNDHIEGTEQNYDQQQVELIFSSDLIHIGENTLTVTSGANLEGTNYDDFVLESIYMEQYGGLRHWLFSYIAPDNAAILLAVILIIFAGAAIYLSRAQKLPVVYQFIVAGVLGIFFGMILFIKIQGIFFGFIFLIPIVIGTVLSFIGLLGLAVAKYLLHRNILPKWFIRFIDPLIFLILTLLSFIISEQYLFFDPGGPSF